MSFRHYRLFLFDADDTLFDFRRSERTAFASTLLEAGVPEERALELLPRYREISHELWGYLEQGRVTQEELRTERFRRLYSAYAIAADPAQAGLSYLDHLSRGTHLIDGALEVCLALKERGARLGIVTNGFKRVQEPRFRASPLATVIGELVISEEFGAAKPDPRIFHHALERVSHLDRDTAVFVGDRLESDIAGAHRAGLASCWFNARGETNGTGIRPSHEISRLEELLK
jgi:YjjG family noncanonical pyrimidine nucleotidase